MKRSPRNSAFDPQNGLRVAERRCNQCLFSKNKVVGDARKAEILGTCEKDGSYFICHKSSGGPAVVCRGFFEEIPNRACYMARALNIVQYVNPAPDTKKVEMEETTNFDAAAGTRELTALIGQLGRLRKKRKPVEPILERMNKLGSRRRPKHRFSVHMLDNKFTVKLGSKEAVIPAALHHYAEAIYCKEEQIK